jgi:hypothetical protein
VSRPSVRPAAAVEVDFEAGTARCPKHGRQRIDDRRELCRDVREYLSLSAQVPGAEWRVCPAGPRVEVRHG